MTINNKPENSNMDEIPYSEITFVQKTDSSIIIQDREKIMDLLVSKLSKKIKTNNGITKALIYGNLHTGGTAQKAALTHYFSFQAQGKQHYLDLKTLRALIENVSQETNTTFTARQLARSFENEIIEFAQKLNLPGNAGSPWKKIIIN